MRTQFGENRMHRRHRHGYDNEIRRAGEVLYGRGSVLGGNFGRTIVGSVVDPCLYQQFAESLSEPTVP
jgi:hypothetical protein